MANRETCKQPGQWQTRVLMEMWPTAYGPWEIAVLDTFFHEKNWHRVIVDYNSGLFEIGLLKAETNSEFTDNLPAESAQHGIPIQLITGNVSSSAAHNSSKSQKTSDIKWPVLMKVGPTEGKKARQRSQRMHIKGPRVIVAARLSPFMKFGLLGLRLWGKAQRLFGRTRATVLMCRTITARCSTPSIN